jgi:hypothetical protein
VVAWIAVSVTLVGAWVAYVAWHRRRQRTLDSTLTHRHRPTLVREDGTLEALVERAMPEDAADESETGRAQQ